MILVSYIERNQLCTLKTDTVDSNWKKVRFYYSQISDQTNSFEDLIELPWHVFITNLNILSEVIALYNVTITYSQEAERLIRESQLSKKKLVNLGENKGISEEELNAILKQNEFDRTLTKEQLRNVLRLSRLQFGATFSVPGAGKTTEAIVFYLLHRKANQKLLVICPKNVFPAWEEQFQDCMPKKKVLIKRLINGVTKIIEELKKNEADIYLISYQQFILASNAIADFLFQNPSFVFIDESHRMKGGDRTGTGRFIQSIAHLPIGKLIMSGTPMPQGITDLIPQYSFLFPSESNLDAGNITDKIKNIYVRTTKGELLNPIDFPLKIIKTPITLSEPQKYLYDLIRSEEFRQLNSVGSDSRKVFRQLSKSYLRLLQVVTNPSLLIKNMTTFPDELREAIEYGDSNKIQYAVAKARQLAKEGKKVLIWSGFVENVEILTQMLSDLGARCIHGKVEAGSEDDENTRERIVKDFHDDPNMFVLVANPAACSEGISLHTICHHSIYLDRNYNAAQYLQSMDRIHRLGLKAGQVTTIEIIHSPNSIDDLIDSRLMVKVKRMSDVLEDYSLNIEPVVVELDESGFDDEDSKELLRHLKG